MIHELIPAAPPLCPHGMPPPCLLCEEAEESGSVAVTRRVEYVEAPDGRRLVCVAEVADAIRAQEREWIAAKLRAEIPLYVGMTIEHPGTWLWGFADKIERGDL